MLAEQKKFMNSRGINMGRQAVVLCLNGAIFTTQFFAIKVVLLVPTPTTHTYWL